MKYIDVYSNPRLVALVEVVVILDRTSSFQTDLVSETAFENVVSFGISSLTFWHAFSLEIQEIPTRDATAVVLNV